MANMILVYLDGSPESEMVLPYVVRLALAADRKIALLSTTRAFEKGKAQAGVYLEQTAARLRSQFGLAQSHMTIRTAIWGDDAGNSILAASKVYAVSEIVLSARLAISLKSRLFKTIFVPTLILLASGDAAAMRFHSFTRPVIVPVDGTPTAEAALPYAIAIARSANVPLILLDVLPSLQEMMFTNALIAEQPWILFSNHILQTQQALLDQSAHEYLTYLRSKWIQPDWKKVLVRLDHGDAAQGIVQAVKTLDAGLIVMAPHPRASLQRLILPSVPEIVFRCTERTVLVISAPSGSGNERGLRLKWNQTQRGDEEVRLAG